jgi:hypothetical protein
VAFALWSSERGGWDRCAMTSTAQGHVVQGTIGPNEHRTYRLALNPAWEVTSLFVQPGEGRAPLELSRGEQGWSSDDPVLASTMSSLGGCLDVHLDFTPAAIAPMLRRMALEVDAHGDTDVVHVSGDALTVRRGSVTVSHLSAYHWLLDTAGVSANVHLGAAGLVAEHQGGWTAMAIG